MLGVLEYKKNNMYHSNNKFPSINMVHCITLRSFDSPIAEDVEARFCADDSNDEIGFTVLRVYTR